LSVDFTLKDTILAVEKKIAFFEKPLLTVCELGAYIAPQRGRRRC
jgi:hypothetical protein